VKKPDIAFPPNGEGKYNIRVDFDVPTDRSVTLVTQQLDQANALIEYELDEQAGIPAYPFSQTFEVTNEMAAVITNVTAVVKDKKDGDEVQATSAYPD